MEAFGHAAGRLKLAMVWPHGSKFCTQMHGLRLEMTLLYVFVWSKYPDVWEPNDYEYNTLLVGFTYSFGVVRDRYQVGQNHLCS